ncbi:hypothetical protein VPH35_049617 [Triticum aestivum]
MSTQESETDCQVLLGDEAEEVEEDDEWGEEEEYESSGSEPIRKRQKASDIWEGFMILKRTSSGELARCSTCGKTSMTSLLTSARSVDKPQVGPDYAAARRSLAMFIINSGLSLSMVEEPSLQMFIRAVNPLSENINSCRRSVLDRDVMALYGREKDSLKFILSEAPGRISFAIDRWKGKENGENYNDDIYMCIVACFIDVDWNLQRRVVAFKHLAFPDDVVSVADTVASCFTEFEVDQKLMCITLDNALDDASVDNSVKTIVLDKDKLLCDGELCQMHCCTEILNSVVQAGLELIDDVVGKIRHGIHYITYSKKREDEFYQCAKEICHLDVAMKLRADLVITWDSTYKMLCCALYYKDALKHFASKHQTFLSNFHLCDEEWNRVATMEKFIKPLYDITCTFLTTKHKTASLYFLGLYKVYRLFGVTKGQENFMAGMVKDMTAKFDKYWSEYSLVLACAAVLDPRYKLNLVSFCFKKIYGDVGASQYTDRVVALLHRLFAQYEKSPSSCSAAVGSGVTEYHAKDDLFDGFALPEQKSELDWYLESPAMHLNTDLDILEFWSGMSKCYPNLANLARDILAIPISTVPSKSVFTVGEKVVNPRRSTLKPDLLEMLISLHDWTCPHDKKGITVSAIEEGIDDEEDEEDGADESDEEESTE